MTGSFAPPGPAIVRALKNATELAAWARSAGFRHLRPSFWHATVILTEIGSPALKLDAHGLHVEPSQDREVRRMGGLIVLSFQSPALMARHEVHRGGGGRWDYVVYRPHVSFAPDDGRDLLDIHPFQGPLIFGPEMMD